MQISSNTWNKTWIILICKYFYKLPESIPSKVWQLVFTTSQRRENQKILKWFQIKYLSPLWPCNENIDIKYSAHDTFLESHSSGDAQHLKIGKPNNLKFWD